MKVRGANTFPSLNRLSNPKSFILTFLGFYHYFLVPYERIKDGGDFVFFPVATVGESSRYFSLKRVNSTL